MMGELHAYVGRQAIFDRRLDVVGYELLYRDSEENRARFNDVTQASAQTMLNAFLEMGLDNLVGKVPAYVNMAADFLLGNYPIPLPPERTVIEVLENIRRARPRIVIDTAVSAAIATAAERGSR